jgi:putative transposase
MCVPAGGEGTGMLNAERSFRRINGYKQMRQLVAALHRHAHPETNADTEK